VKIGFPLVFGWVSGSEKSYFAAALVRKASNDKQPILASGRSEIMQLLTGLWSEEDGQGLVEYTLIVLLVALVFWVAIKNTNVGSQLASAWSKVTACVGSPSSCDSSS
jgi:Flp pilus assembly pilin Flp